MYMRGLELEKDRIYFKISMGVRQSCVLSGLLLALMLANFEEHVRGCLSVGEVSLSCML